MAIGRAATTLGGCIVGAPLSEGDILVSVSVQLLILEAAVGIDSVCVAAVAARFVDGAGRMLAVPAAKCVCAGSVSVAAAAVGAVGIAPSGGQIDGGAVVERFAVGVAVDVKALLAGGAVSPLDGGGEADVSLPVEVGCGVVAQFAGNGGVTGAPVAAAAAGCVVLAADDVLLVTVGQRGADAGIGVARLAGDAGVGLEGPVGQGKSAVAATATKTGSRVPPTATHVPVLVFSGAAAVAVGVRTAAAAGCDDPPGPGTGVIFDIVKVAELVADVAIAVYGAGMTLGAAEVVTPA